ncbi:MAG TPA: GDSL-type esterase/lipase family protein, partial [Dokdonella sp.]
MLGGAGGAGGANGGSRNTSSGGATTGGRSVSGGAATGGASGGGTGGANAAGTSGMNGAAGGPWTFPAGVTKPRLMIVGDSISAGPGCYKKYLLKNLTDNHYSNFEFVGQYSDDCGGGVRHSAVSCSTAEQFTQASFTMPNCSQGTSFPGMSTLMNTHKPDLVMLQLGVNDVWGGRATTAILASYATLLQQARAQNGSVVLVVAQINKIRPDCSTSDAVTLRAESLVKAIPAWAAAQSTAKSPVFV